MREIKGKNGRARLDLTLYSRNHFDHQCSIRQVFEQSVEGSSVYSIFGMFTSKLLSTFILG